MRRRTSLELAIVLDESGSRTTKAAFPRKKLRVCRTGRLPIAVERAIALDGLLQACLRPSDGGFDIARLYVLEPLGAMILEQLDAAKRADLHVGVNNGQPVTQLEVKAAGKE